MKAKISRVGLEYISNLEKLEEWLNSKQGVIADLQETLRSWVRQMDALEKLYGFEGVYPYFDTTWNGWLYMGDKPAIRADIIVGDDGVEVVIAGQYYEVKWEEE